MAQIRQIQIKNFRSIKDLTWNPRPGLNCLIGPGDSGKSTVIDAIDLALGARRSFPFSDADFFRLDTNCPIEIFVTLGELEDHLKNIDLYGHFLRGFDHANGQLMDEPSNAIETVITVKLTVSEDLEPDWQLYSDRALVEGVERRLNWKHREQISPSRLGATGRHHLAWGNNSILNKLSDEQLDVSSILAAISRQTRINFAQQPLPELDGVLAQVKTIADKLGVSIGQLQARLDVDGVSLSKGAIGLHNEDNSPLRQLGTGSTRLLISGLQQSTNSSNVLLVDEAEYGLEPFRITRLLNELGSKETQPTKQVFITTHSPYVLRELSAHQLNVLRRASPPPPDQQAGSTPSHYIYMLGNSEQEQATLRACAEAFLSRKVIVCEGKTEIGLVKGIDLYSQEQGNNSIHAYGTHCADGNGDSMFERAKVFASLGYPTALFKDSDITTPQHASATQEARQRGIYVFEWGNSLSTEGAVFSFCPASCIPSLLDTAAEWKGEDSIDQHIKNFSNNQYNLQICRNQFHDGMRQALISASGKKGWYKDIGPAEKVAKQIICPAYNNFSAPFTTMLNSLFQWASC